jgi:regulator of replication initiation timing
MEIDLYKHRHEYNSVRKLDSFLSSTSVSASKAQTQQTPAQTTAPFASSLGSTKNSFSSQMKPASTSNMGGGSITGGGASEGLLDGQKEASVIQEHIKNLEFHNDSLTRQLNFLKTSKTNLEEKYQESMSRLVKQMTNLNNLYQSSKKENDELFQSLCEKESSLQRAMIQMQSLQDDMKKLVQEKAQHFKMRRESTQEL